jgi:hypothetical protein
MRTEISLEAPVLLVNGEYVLMVPLNCDAAEFAQCTHGIAVVQGDFLKIVIPPWLAGALRVEAGDRVVVSSESPKFGINELRARVN